ncbi:MAG: hypothetical protein ACRDXX_18865 [Stackebrandtia sp.]
MKTLSKLAVAALFAVTALFAVGAEAAPAQASPPSESANAKISVSPGKIKAGQKVKVKAKCAKADLDVRLNITGPNGLSYNVDLTLADAVLDTSTKVPDVAVEGTYKVNLTCNPSGAKASAKVTVE